MHAHSKICLSVKDDPITRIDSMYMKTSPVTTGNNRYESTKEKFTFRNEKSNIFNMRKFVRKNLFLI